MRFILLHHNKLFDELINVCISSMTSCNFHRSFHRKTTKKVI